MKRTSRNDIVSRIEKEFPIEQRARVLSILEPFAQDNHYNIHELILDRARGNIDEVERMADIAKGYAFDPRDRWELINDPDRVFNSRPHGGFVSQSVGIDINAQPKPTMDENRFDVDNQTTPAKISVKSVIGILFLLILSSYFFVKSMTVISFECEKTTDTASNRTVTCKQSNQVFGLKFGNITYAGVTGARLGTYTEHLPGKGWYTYHRVALNTPQVEYFLTDGSLNRASQEEAVQRINQYNQDANQSKLSITFPLESDWTYFFISIAALGYFVWNYFRKRK